MARKSRAQAAAPREIESSAVWKAALYCRLSVEDGDDIEQNSIGNQKKLGMAFLAEQVDMALADIFTDHGYSGMNYKRPGFAAMEQAMERGAVNCVIVKDISRFGRAYLPTSEYLQRIFPLKGIRLISLNDDYDSLKPNADVEGLLLPFKMILNDSYAKDTSLRIRSSIEVKMNNGTFLPASGSIPYGYLRDAAGNTFAIDPAAAPVVREIFELRAGGMAFHAIAKHLTAKGLPSPGRLRYLRGLSKDRRFASAEWTRGIVRKITGDPVYLGNRVHGKLKRDRLGEEKTPRDKSEWKILSGSHPAIVTNELFAAVQAVNEAERRRWEAYAEHAKPELDYRDLLREKVFCGDCGARMLAMKHDQRRSSKLLPTVIYQCNSYQSSNRRSCESHYTPTAAILTALQSVIEQQVLLSADMEAELRRAARIFPKAEDGELRSIRMRRKNLESKLEQLLRDLTDGLLDREEYENMKVRYAQERDGLLEKEREAELRELAAKEASGRAQQWYSSLKAYGEHPELTKELVDLLVDRIYIYKDKRIQIVLNYGDPYRAFASARAGEEADDAGA